MLIYLIKPFNGLKGWSSTTNIIEEFMETFRFLVSSGSAEPKSLGRGSEVPQRIPMCTTVCSQCIKCVQKGKGFIGGSVSLVNLCESFSKCGSRSTTSLTWELTERPIPTPLPPDQTLAGCWVISVKYAVPNNSNTCWTPLALITTYLSLLRLRGLRYGGP